MKTLKDIVLKDKVVGVRVDLNVPITDGKVTNDNRIRAVIPTIKAILDAGAKRVLIFSHRGRPEAGVFSEDFSLAPVLEPLSSLLSKKISLDKRYLEDSFLNTIKNPEDFDGGAIVLMENTRMLLGEKKNDETLSSKLSNFVDVFVMDAFATSHRAECTTTGILAFAKEVCAGLLLEAEIKALEQVSQSPKRPLACVVGGAKVSTKLPILERLASISDILIVGGGMANTFLMASGFKVGKSLCEPELLEVAKTIMSQVSVVLPKDVIVAKEISKDAETRVCLVSEVQDDEMILDFGPKTMAEIGEKMSDVKTILLNGPVGVFEMKPFEAGTKALLDIIAESQAFSIAGGGDTVAAVEQFKKQDKISYISTAGGAFLEYIQGLELPALVALEKRG